MSVSTPPSVPTRRGRAVAATAAAPPPLGWEQRAGFGPYLRGLRESARLSLRAAAEDLGLSYSYLSMMETGAKSNPPSIKLLRRIADVYARDLREVLAEAGFEVDGSAGMDPPTDSLDERFRRLVMHPALRPMRMDDVVIELIPPLVKHQWIEFARKLEASITGGTAEVDRLLARSGGSLPSSDGPAASASNVDYQP
ncbi:MAG: helix-turn-helix transcriptional regulator [Myxococcota bacterium]